MPVHTDQPQPSCSLAVCNPSPIFGTPSLGMMFLLPGFSARVHPASLVPVNYLGPGRSSVSSFALDQCDL